MAIAKDAAINNSQLISEASTFRLGYRGDIEGLRALAILLVIAAHAGVPWLAGGFVGVDVFFVLSGYLITGLLLQEIRVTGGLRLWKFYARRLRRLLPALLFMVICTSLLAMTLLAPFEQLNIIPAARAASVWVSNIYFAFTDFDYFAPASDENLFLHTWSLGVEEQFYLVWPVLLMLLLGTWHWQGSAQNLRRLQFGMITTIGLFLLLSIFLTYKIPSWGFYLMPSRAWQFAMGALALLWSTRTGRDVSNISSLRVSRRTSRILAMAGWAGIALILGSAMLLDPNTAYPSAWALLPSTGAVLVLITGATANAASVSRVMSLPPMQWTGRISYSWYLWHWPILVLGGTLFSNGEGTDIWLLVALSLGLAVFSYWAVESPIRRNKKLSARTGLALVVSLLLMSVALVFSTAWQYTAISWSESPEQKLYYEHRANLPVIYQMGCDELHYSPQVRICEFGDKDAAQTVVLIGDSIMVQWFPALSAAYDKPGWRLLVLTKSACPMVDAPFFYKRIGKEYTVCSRWRDDALATLASIKPDVVFIGGASNYGFSESQWITGTRRVLSKIAPVTKEVFLLRATHRLPFDGPGCLARRDWQPAFLSIPGECSSAADSQHETDVFAWLKEAASDFDNVTIIDLNPVVCPDGRCYAEMNGKIVFRDSQHLSSQFSETLSEIFFTPIATGNPLILQSNPERQQVVHFAHPPVENNGMVKIPE
ncbi:MAG: acyltransferase [bacterium]|nr:acyltransferase [bacterium]